MGKCISLLNCFFGSHFVLFKSQSQRRAVEASTDPMMYHVCGDAHLFPTVVIVVLYSCVKCIFLVLLTISEAILM